MVQENILLPPKQQNTYMIKLPKFVMHQCITRIQSVLVTMSANTLVTW